MWIYKKYDVELRIRFNWLDIGHSGGFLWTRYWIIGFHRLWKMYWPANGLSASLTQICSSHLICLTFSTNSFYSQLSLVFTHALHPYRSIAMLLHSTSYYLRLLALVIRLTLLSHSVPYLSNTQAILDGINRKEWHGTAGDKAFIKAQPCYHRLSASPTKESACSDGNCTGSVVHNLV